MKAANDANAAASELTDATAGLRAATHSTGVTVEQPVYGDDG